MCVYMRDRQTKATRRRVPCARPSLARVRFLIFTSKVSNLITPLRAHCERDAENIVFAVQKNNNPNNDNHNNNVLRKSEHTPHPSRHETLVFFADAYGSSSVLSGY